MMSRSNSGRWQAGPAKTVLVTGSGERAQRLAETLRSAGHRVTLLEPMTAADPVATAGVLPSRIDHYLQLPITVTLRGDTLVGRVRSFLTDGLLTRFSLVERVLPLFTENATVSLVAGNVAAGSPIPDDQRSRITLMRVLARAACAELAERNVRIQILTDDREDDEILNSLFETDVEPVEPVPEYVVLPSQREYQDWRTEMMGLTSQVSA